MAQGTSLGLFQGLPSPSSSSLETAKALNIEAYKSPDRASGHWLKEGMVEDGAHFHKSHQGGDLWNGKERHRMLGPALYTGEICPRDTLLRSSEPFSQSSLFSLPGYVLNL